MDLNATYSGNSSLKEPTVPAKRPREQADVEDRDAKRRAPGDWPAGSDVAGSSAASVPIDPHPHATMSTQHLKSLPDLSPPPDPFPTSPHHESQTSPSPALTYPSSSFPDISQPDQFLGSSVPPPVSPNQFPDSSVSPPASIPQAQSRPSIVLNQSGNALSES